METLPVAFVQPNYCMDTNLGPRKLRVTIQIEGIRSSTVFEFTKNFIPKIYKKTSNGSIVFDPTNDGFLFEFRAIDTSKNKNYRLKVTKLPGQVDISKSHYVLRDDAVELILVRSNDGSWASVVKEGLNVDLS